MNFHNRIVFIFVAVILAGCAAMGGQSIIVSQPTAPQEMNLRATSGDLQLVLNHVISAGGPGSWVRGAMWDEYNFNIINLSRSDIIIDKFSLVDARGLYIETEKKLRLNESVMQEMATGGINPLADLGFGVVGTVLDSFVLGFPVFGLANGVRASTAPQMQANTLVSDTTRFESEIRKRAYDIPFRMASGATIKGSVFFQSISAREIVIDYTIGGKPKQAR
ncbi:hypothetical protein HYT00_02550 [Candidatus Giovannonibacteria bacterium]|nr:hypothetical protein [Candidatus Giovannonibacteria bacterium]